MASAASVFTVRRHQPTRLEGFVDASFAFAVTLVVISVGHVPESVPQMLDALRGMPTFAICFLLIARIWKSHRDWSRHYDLEDGRAVSLSLLLVLLVLIFVYPLRLLFSLMFAGLSGGWLAERAIGIDSEFELRAAFVVFGLGYFAIWVVLALLYRHAYALRTAIGLDPVETLTTRQHVLRNAAFAAIALFSAALAATLPFAQRPGTIWLPGLSYLLLIPTAILLRRRVQRALATAERA